MINYNLHGSPPSVEVVEASGRRDVSSGRWDVDEEGGEGDADVSPRKRNDVERGGLPVTSALSLISDLKAVLSLQRSL